MLKLFKMNYHPQLTDMMSKSVFVGTFSVNILTPFLLAYIFHGYLEETYIQWWLALNVIIFFSRVLLGHRLVSSKYSREQVDVTLHVTLWVISFSAMLHAYALWYLSFYISDVELFFVAIITVAMVSGSISTLGSVYHSFAIFVTLSLIPIIYIFSFKGGEMFYIFSFAIFTFMFVMLRSGHNMYSSLKENIELKESFEVRVKESTLELKEKNNRLNESLHSFEDLQEASMLMIAFQDENGVMIGINEAAAKKYGYENKDEIIGLNMLEFLPEKSIPIVMAKLKEESSEPYELVMKKKDGTQFPTLISARYTILNGKKVRMTTMMDLTDVKEKEKLLHKQARLAQMGEMISMIAHQWRQPLNAISATSSSINLKAKLGKLDIIYAQEMTDNISEYAQHLSETIDDFRNFFKPNKEKSETSYSELLEPILKIIESSIFNNNISLIKNLECQDYFISYPNELKQVILNLFKNAEDALVDNNIHKPFIRVHTYTKDTKFILELSDNAGGVSEDIIDKIFNPYFSTKKKKDGTGLGLYMSKLIIEEHCNGELNIQNSQDGAVFRIILGKVI